METPDLNSDSAGRALERLEQLVARLRGPDGCPWDRRQTPRTMATYLIEETYELVEAILGGSAEEVCEELGDVFFHLVFIASIYQAQGRFSLAHALAGIQTKMIHRHPHVFADATVESTAEVKTRWEELKQKEPNHRPKNSLLDSIPGGLPGLVKAYRVSSRAAGIGFDWDTLAEVMDKAVEEWGELKEALNQCGQPPSERDDPMPSRAAALELGDLLFTLVNVGRWARIHPETALQDATLKFERRFRHMEASLTRNGRSLKDISREELEAGWEQAKAELD